MSQAKDGDTVQIHYKGTLEDGSVFDSSEGRDPLQFTLGGGQVIPGFDAAVQGMAVEDNKTVTIPADQAYGEKREDLIIKVPRAECPPELEPEVGQKLAISGPNGQPIPVQVVEVTDEQISLDANHELAGEALTFEITLVSIGN